MRARNLKPGIFKNELLGASDPINTVIFEGLWCLADRAGRLEDRPLRIHVEINPYRHSASTVQALEWLVQHGFVIRYTSGESKLLQIVNFLKHQQPHINEQPSKLPSVSDQGVVIAPYLHSAGTVGLALTPSSLTPDSLFSDSLSRTVAEEPRPVEVPRGTKSVDPEISEVFEHWKQTHQHPKAALDRKRRKLIGIALGSYSVADLCRSISGYRHSPHHMGQNANGTIYDSLELMLRDAEHIDAGMKFYQQPPTEPESDFDRAMRLNGTPTRREESDDERPYIQPSSEPLALTAGAVRN